MTVETKLSVWNIKKPIKSLEIMAEQYANACQRLDVS